MNRVLIATLAPSQGGVYMMTDYVVQVVRQLGLEPVIAHYAPYSTDPLLSVPSFKLLQRQVGAQVGRSHGGAETHALGAWLPELEFTHYWPTRQWRDVMDGCDAFVAVAGNALAALPFEHTGRDYVAWVASDWHGDRRDRVRRFPWFRRVLDACINGPVIRRMEAKLLRAGRVLSLSEHTATMLAGVAGDRFERTLLPMPVDTAHFTPDPAAVRPGRIGFVGRLDDPRKNVDLMLSAVARLRARGRDAQAFLVTDHPTQALQDRIASHGLGDNARIARGSDRQVVRDHLQTFDVFALPSWQEGLCIAALEAMACGIPVVSTRCGGPEEFVLPGQTGDTTGFDADDMADAIDKIVSDRALRESLGRNARALVEQRYAASRTREVLERSLLSTFPNLRPCT